MKIEPRPVTTTKFFTEITGKEFDVEMLADFLYCIDRSIDTEMEMELEDILIDMKVMCDEGFRYQKGLNFENFYKELIDECEKIKAFGFDISFAIPLNIRDD